MRLGKQSNSNPKRIGVEPMTQIIETTVYSFDELSDAAKEKARDWYREGALDYDWYDSVYSDAKEAGRILGIEITDIFFSGFCSQGDGACFEGRYSYAKQSAKKIREYAPQDTILHSIADSLQAIQAESFYSLEASVKHRGHYSHEFCTDIDVFDGRSGDCAPVDVAEAITKELRRLMKWIYRQLEADYDYLNSDESVDETIKINEYTFTESGRRFG